MTSTGVAKKDKKTNSKSHRRKKNKTSKGYKGPAADNRHLGALGPICKAQRVGLDVTRAAQRNVQRLEALMLHKLR